MENVLRSLALSIPKINSMEEVGQVFFFFNVLNLGPKLEVMISISGYFELLFGINSM